MSAPGATPKQSLSEELRDYYEQIENIKEDVVELTAPLNDAQFNWRPAPSRWSISECLAHLNVADGLDVPLISKEIDQARSAGLTGQGPFKYGRIGRMIIRFTEPPVKLRTPAPKIYVPPAGEPKDKVVPEFLSIHDRILELVAKSNGLHLARIKVPTSIPRLKFSLGQRFALLTSHDRRHLHQAWDVRKRPDFPT